MLIDRVGPFTKPYISTSDDLFISGGAKIWLDGSRGGRTAWVYKGWNKNYTEIYKGNFGYPAFDPEVFCKMVKMLHDAAFYISVHAIGDRSIDYLVDTYAKILEEDPIHGLRHGIIHCNIPTGHAIDVMGKLQKTHDIGLQSTFMWWIGDKYVGNFGPERCPRFMPFKTFSERRMKWGGDSDFNVTPFPAKYGIRATITRKPETGSYGEYPYGTKEFVDVRMHCALIQSGTLINYSWRMR